MNDSVPPVTDPAAVGSDPTSEHSVAPRDEREASSPRVALPVILFLLTCASTFLVGGLAFSAAIMTILLTHELGHFLQARRYGVPASLPYFLPMPLTVVGTLGAVIAMHPGMGNRKSLFDIAITGPLAGLVPAIACCIVGLPLSEVQPVVQEASASTVTLGEPLLFRWLASSVFGQLPEGYDIVLHPLGYAGWVGLFITALNLIPIGQLDGGHILYSLLRKRAHFIATLLLVGATAAVVAFGYWGWTLMLLLLLWIGPQHPPTADDTVALGTTRTCLGWLSLLFVFVGFTPTPFTFSP